MKKRKTKRIVRRPVIDNMPKLLGKPMTSGAGGNKGSY